MLLMKLNEEKYFSQGNMMGAAKGAGPMINIQYPKAVPLWVCKSSAEQSNCGIMHRTMYQKYDWDNR